MSVAYGAFAGCGGLTAVVMPESVTRIAVSAFDHCVGITSVTIPGSVTSIGDHAFSGCSALKVIYVGQGGDVNSVRQMLSESGFDVDGVTFDYVGGTGVDEVQLISLAGAGWHEVSFAVLPAGGDPADVFAPIEDKIGYVTYGSLNWNPLTGGTLTALEIGKGYWVQTKAENVSWTVTGQGNPDVEIALKPGWNLIGYPLPVEGEVETVLATALATDKIDFIYSGSRVYPGTLTTLTPGKGYWVYANAAVTINFDAK